MLINAVAPFAGAWIEILHIGTIGEKDVSLPSRERGLKYSQRTQKAAAYRVAPFAGAWIEILYTASISLGSAVAPFAGAWIEIR